MSADAIVPRFIARKDARGTWMVWDRVQRGPAEPKRDTVGLTETQAKWIAEQLALDPAFDPSWVLGLPKNGAGTPQ
jgi:hypothetical protein